MGKRKHAAAPAAAPQASAAPVAVAPVVELTLVPSTGAPAAAPAGASSEDAALDKLLGDLTGGAPLALVGDTGGLGNIADTGAGSEVIGDAVPGVLEGGVALLTDATGDTGSDATLVNLLEEVGAEAETKGQMQQLYAKQPGAEPDASQPQPLVDAGIVIPPAATKPPKPPKPAKVPRATSVTHNPGDLLRLHLGSATHLLTLSAPDLTLDPAKLTARHDLFIARLNERDAIATKVKEKIAMLLMWLKDGGELNTVLERTLRLLHSAGTLVSGDKGNLELNLLAKPYTIGTARSQANQMFMALPELAICNKVKGSMTANPDSVLWPMIQKKLGLA
jgi:hypothetical protein